MVKFQYTVLAADVQQFWNSPSPSVYALRYGQPEVFTFLIWFRLSVVFDKEVCLAFASLGLRVLKKTCMDFVHKELESVTRDKSNCDDNDWNCHDHN